MSQYPSIFATTSGSGDPTDSDYGFPFWRSDEDIRDRARRGIIPFGDTAEELRDFVERTKEEADAFERRYGHPEKFLLFAAWPRSGHSLLGALLDAHPEMVIAHEAHALKLRELGVPARQLLYFCWQNARHYGKAGRLWGEFDYSVRGSWQGEIRQLKIIGDKKGGESSLYMSTRARALEQLTSHLGLPLRVILAVRNPLDNIATMGSREERPRRAKAGLDAAIARYTRCAEINARLVETRQKDVLAVWHEDFIAEPIACLKKVARFLGVEENDSWLEACRAIMRPSVSRSRDRVNWTLEQMEAVKALTEKFDFLQRYRDDPDLASIGMPRTSRTISMANSHDSSIRQVKITIAEPRLTPAIPIETVGTMKVTAADLVSDWRSTVRGAGNVGDSGAKLSVQVLLEEAHHHAYGRPWFIGRVYADFLMSKGMKADHNVLDFGCGAGRTAIWLIPQLKEGRYFGVDGHLASLVAFSAYEIRLHNLAARRPRLLWDRTFAFHYFGKTFEWILDLSVSRHLPRKDRLAAYRSARSVLAPNGRIIVPHAPALTSAELGSLGLVVESRILRDGKSPEAARLKSQRLENDWHIIVAADGTRA